MSKAHFKNFLSFLILLIAILSVGETMAQQKTADRPPAWFGKTSRDGKYVVWEAHVRYLDSIYTAKGYNDARHMNVIPVRDTGKYSPTPSFGTILDKQLRNDGLVSTHPADGETLRYRIDPVQGLLYINNEPRSKEVSKKYVDMYAKFQEQQKRDLDPNEKIADERRDYLFNLIVIQLLQDKIVGEGETLTFKLNKDEFIVNDKLQSTQTYKRYYDKFIGSLPAGSRFPGWAMKQADPIK